MSELKVHKAYNRWIDEEMPTPNDDLICNEVYLKYEADKVIADLEESHKMEVEQLLMEIMNLKHSLELASNECCSISERGVKNARHQKYKRCLSMAGWCEERCARYDLLQEHSGFSWRREIDFYFRWSRRWLELAEKFKEV